MTSFSFESYSIKLVKIGTFPFEGVGDNWNKTCDIIKPQTYTKEFKKAIYSIQINLCSIT
jgi:hypothetical protein